MGRVDALLRSYTRYVALPWDAVLPGAQRVWFAVYDERDERRLRLRLPNFELATKDAGHGWRGGDVTDDFAHWLAARDYRKEYFESPGDLPVPHPEFEEYVATQVLRELEVADENTIVAILGVASLFGFMRVSTLMERVERSVRGRLLVFFPGKYAENHYRLLDARDGWNYHAVPITASGGVLES